MFLSFFKTSLSQCVKIKERFLLQRIEQSFLYTLPKLVFFGGLEWIFAISQTNTSIGFKTKCSCRFKKKCDPTRWNQRTLFVPVNRTIFSLYSLKVDISCRFPKIVCEPMRWNQRAPFEPAYRTIFSLYSLKMGISRKFRVNCDSFSKQDLPWTLPLTLRRRFPVVFKKSFWSIRGRFQKIAKIYRNSFPELKLPHL